MKKKIFLITLMVSLLVCLFVISASAREMFTSEYTTEITKFYDTDGTTVLAPDFANVTDTKATAVLKKADGTYVRVPSYYIFKADSKNQFVATGTNFDLSWVSEKLGEAQTLTIANLVAFEIPHGTTSFTDTLSEDTFSGLTELVIPSTIESAPDRLLRNNDVIKKVFVKQVRNIEDGTIQGITEIPNYFADITDSSVSHLEFFALELDYVTIVKTRAFEKSAIKEIRLKGPITSIGDYMLYGCTYLETVSIINTLSTPATCGSHMCDGLKNLKSVELTGISIGTYAFNEINGSDIKLSFTNVGSIGEKAFYKAGNVTELYISGPFTSVGANTYRECPKLTKLTLINTGDTTVSAGNGESNPLLEELRIEGKFNIGSPAFQNNNSLKKLYLGTGVNEIGKAAFKESFALETAYLADTITSIGDSAFDMNGAGKQTSTSFMFVDEKGNMDNTLPASLIFTGGHFLKGYTFANTQLIYPTSYTSAANSAYDFESAVYPEGFSIVYLGKMTKIDQYILYKHNDSDNVTIYLAGNTANDLSGERVNVNIASSGSMSHGTYAGSTTGTLEIVVDNNLQNNIKATSHVKFVFCGSNEVVFVTRVNIPRVDGGSASWGNFVSIPVTYEQLKADYDAYNTANPDAQVTIPAKHPVLTAPEYFAPDCTNDGGTKVFCVGCNSLVSFDKTEDALGHNHDIMNAISIVYADYTKDGIFTAECLRCHEAITEAVEGSHLFEYKGVSMSERGDGLCAGYLLNDEYIEAYKKLKGDTFEYGVLATIVTGENKSPLSSGYPTNVIRVALNDRDANLSAVDIVVRGSYTDKAPENIEDYDVYSLAMSMYVIDGSSTYYIWDNAETTTANNTVVTTTTIYNPKQKA